MGLAASQARFLGLTARKSNVEYQGQQINQQRTALSNEIMGLYSEYSSLEVPVPPAVNDYTKTTYTLDSTYEKYQIESFSKITSGEYAGYYDVTLICDDAVPKAYSNMFGNAVVTSKERTETTEGTVGKYSYLSFAIGTDVYTYDEAALESSNLTRITSDYSKYSGLSTIMQSQGLTDGVFYMFTKDGKNYYTSEADLNSVDFEEITNSDGTASDKKSYNGRFSFDYEGEQKTSKKVYAKAMLTQNDSGGLSDIRFIDCEEDTDLVNNSYTITTGSTEDNAAYKDAMNKWQYQKDLYEREVERINAKTKTIQEEDRSLELQLNQLDTEQNALKTEMDSVSKVIEETMEKVFKTFSG